MNVAHGNVEKVPTLHPQLTKSAIVKMSSGINTTEVYVDDNSQNDLRIDQAEEE
jgi:hypothetical protein